MLYQTMLVLLYKLALVTFYFNIIRILYFRCSFLIFFYNARPPSKNIIKIKSDPNNKVSIVLFSKS